MHCLCQHISGCELLTTDYSCLLLPVSAVCNLLFVLGEWLSKSRGFRVALSIDDSSVPTGPDPKPTEFTRKVSLILSGFERAQDGWAVLSALGAHEKYTVTTPSASKKSVSTNIPLLLVKREHKHSQRKLKSPSNQYSWMLFAAFISALSTVYASQMHVNLQHWVMLINRAVKGFLMHLCQVLHSRSYSNPGELTGEPLW